MVYSSLLAVILSLSAYLSIPLPFTQVMLTAQSLVVMIIGLTMSPLVAFSSVGLYLLIGLLGFPVFSGGHAGLSVVLGPSGGYLIGFCLGAWVTALLKRSLKGWLGRFASVLVGGIGVVYAAGVLGLMMVLQVDVAKAMLIGVLPFLLPDLLKAVFATWLTSKYQKNFGKISA